MYFYKIGYSTYEGASSKQYFHSEKFTEEEIDEMIEAALFQSYEKMAMAGEYGCTIIEFLMDDTSFHEYFLRNGFLPIKYTASKYIFGWNDILEDIWQHDTEPKEKEMLARLKDKIEKYNANK